MSHSKLQILVTGSTKGIGQAITTYLIEKGYSVIGIARSPSSCLHPDYHHHVVDLSKIQDLSKALDPIKKQYPNIYGIIANAGKGLFGCLENFSDQQIQELLNINLTSQLILIKTFLPLMKKQKKGKIILMGSESALEGKKQGTIYCASKFAIRGFSQALRQEVKSSNISVSLINAGLVQTSFFDDLDFSPGPEKGQHITAQQIAEMVNTILAMDSNISLEEVNLKPSQQAIIKTPALSKKE